MAEEELAVTKSNRKPYNGRIRGDSFDVINRCQAFTADVYNASAGASKEYRFTVCRKVQTYSCELVHITRLANCYDLHTQTEARIQTQKEAGEMIEKIFDMLPVIRRCRCITPGQEKELNNKLTNLKFAFNKWIESDAYRIRQSKSNKQG